MNDDYIESYSMTWLNDVHRWSNILVFLVVELFDIGFFLALLLFFVFIFFFNIIIGCSNVFDSF